MLFSHVDYKDVWVSRKLLYLMAYVHIAGGILLPFITHLAPVKNIIRHSLAGTPAQDGAVFWVGVFGPTVASWGVLFLCLLNIYFAQASLRVWRSLVLSVLLWGVVDTTYCLLLGVPQALLSNLPAMFLLLLPLLRLHPKYRSGVTG